MAFLTIYTPTYCRPSLLQVCEASVQAQTCQDIQHLVIRDEIGVGIAGMFAAIPAKTLYMSGKYVYILQDDDILADNQAVEELQAYAGNNRSPEVIICRNRKRAMILPTSECWQRKPVIGHIDLGSYIVRLDVFRKYADQFGQRYAGDFDFINRLWFDGVTFSWWDRLFAVEQLTAVPGLGRPEKELMRYAR